MAIRSINKPVSGASSFQSLVHTDPVGKPQERVIIELSDSLRKLKELESGQSSAAKARKFSFNFEDFLNLKD